MIAAPQCDVVANRYEWLDSVVFKQEDIFTDPPIVQDGSVGAHIAGEFIAESANNTTPRTTNCGFTRTAKITVMVARPHRCRDNATK